jgi:hypothetical protein
MLDSGILHGCTVSSSLPYPYCNMQRHQGQNDGCKLRYVTRTAIYCQHALSFVGRSVHSVGSRYSHTLSPWNL